MKYIAYYRVSTEKQNVSGLGLEGQRMAVVNHIKPESIFKEFTEVESGKKKQRPILSEALELCKAEKATLVIAKLDRLARNVQFISALMESGVKFLCCDMPSATELTIHIYSAIAQDEAKRISERTKQALKVKKSQGFKLGTNNLTNVHRRKGTETRIQRAIENPNNKRARAYLKTLEGTLQYKADLLNENGFRTSTGKLFSAMQVRRLL